MYNLSKRLNALETKLSPQGQMFGIFAMTDDFRPMAEQEIVNKIAAMQRAGATANARFELMTCDPVCDPH